MGLSIAGATAIAAGVGALGTGGQMLATGSMNKKTRWFADEMMRRQRDWALSDYAMQNEYNSPQAQMRRLKEAGLNPNLIYGNGADAQGGIVRSTDTAQWKPEVPNVQQGIQGAGQLGLSAYQTFETTQLQNNLLKSQNTIAEREIQLKEIQAQAMQLGILDKSFDLDLKGDLRSTNLQFRKKQVETLDQSIMESLTRMSNTTWQGNRESIRLTSDMQTAGLQRQIMELSKNKSVWEQKQIEQNIQNMIKTGELQQMQNDLQRKMQRLNLNYNDPAIMKLITSIVDKLGKGN